MNYSLNEIEALAKKATRGAGYSWGLAEEAGKTVRWLYQHNIDGCAALCGLLRQVDGADLREFFPDPTALQKGAMWHAPYKLMCPLTTGAVLSDRALILKQTRIVLRDVLASTLLFYFTRWLVQQRDAVLSISWSGGKAIMGVDVFYLDGLLPEPVETLTLEFISDSNYAPSSLNTRAQLNQSALTCLDQFAQRTYAPASEASRVRGAGAGLSDND